jgi:hypothetical protein
MTRASIVVGVAAALVAATTFAGDLSRYRGWDKSPQGDLMTAAERAQWAEVKTDDDADKFVKHFLARRGPEFLAEINQAAAAADSYLTVGTTPGSLTERGKLIIILGPPGAMSLSQRFVRNDVHSFSQPPTSATGATVLGGVHVGSNGSIGTGDEIADMSTSRIGRDSLSEPMSVFVLTYPAEKLPAAYGKSLTIRIQVDPSGKDRVIDRKTQAVLDQLYEMAAETRLAQSGSASQ